jgi:hypothetical protein
MERALALTSLFLLAPAIARAQVVEVEVRERAAVRGSSQYLLELDGRLVLRGEPVYRVEPDQDGRIGWSEWGFELFVGDLDEPEDVPYTWKKDERVPRSKARLAEIPAKHLVSIRMVAPYLTLGNLADEVRERRTRIAQLERRRAQAQPGSDAWFDEHYLLLEQHRRLQILLERHGFEPAARKLDPEVRRLSGEASADPRWTRSQEALGSILPREVPARLEEVAARISGGSDRFAVHESRHLRLVHDPRIDVRRARELLTLGEEVIEGFRREFVDPFECPDLIPERIFSEFWFGPDDDAKYARYYEEYYGMSWGTPEQKARSLRWYGTYPARGSPPEFLSYCRAPWRDLAGLIAHRIGDQLESIHFEARLRDGYKPGQDWLQEALGLHVSLELFGASTTACVSFEEVSSSKGTSRARTWNERPVDYFRSLASASALPVDQLVLRNLAELDAQDVAQGLSLMRFLLADGARGQDVLHSATRRAREPRTFLSSWREDLRWFYAVEEGDPLEAMEGLWRASLPAEK